MCYVYTLQKDRNKFSHTTEQCVFLGYFSGYEGYKVLHLDTNIISVSRNVIFHETIFPFKADLHSSPSSDVLGHNILPLPIPAVLDSSTLNHIISPSSNVSSAHVSPSASASNSGYVSASSSGLASASHSSPNAKHHVPSSVTGGNPAVPATQPVVSLHNARPRRSAKAPGYLLDYHCSMAQLVTLPPKLFTTPYPLSSILTHSNLNLSYKSYILSISVETESKSFKQAILSVKWTNAMDVELGNMESTKTWSVVSLPPGKNVVGCKWVYTIKDLAYGSIERYKTHLVAQGFTQ